MTWHNAAALGACICFALAVFGVGGKVNVLALGLLCLALATLVV